MAGSRNGVSVPDFGNFHDQFLLSRSGMGGPPGWAVRSFGGWHLATHPRLPVVRLLDPSGREAGFALGHLIDPDGHIVRGDLTVCSVEDAGAEASIERTVYLYGGRFAFLFLGPGLPRVYLDPVGSLAAVWCGQRGRIASTVGLLLFDEPGHPYFQIPQDSFPVHRPNQFYPAGLTPVPDVFRLLPNHYLDLGIWAARRHHPKVGYAAVSPGDVPRLAATVHQIARRQIGAAIRARGGAYVTLTAGKDSRKVLACAREFLDDIEVVTFSYPMARFGNSQHVDLEIATGLARRFGLRQRILRIEGPFPPELYTQYLDRIGRAGGKGKARDFFAGPMAQLDLSRAWLSGFSGEVGSWHQYAKRHPRDRRPDAVSLLRIMGLPAMEGFTEAIDRWLSGLPQGDTTFCLDMLQFEFRVGSWACPHLYGGAPFQMNLLPFCHRDAYDAMLSVPEYYRHDYRFSKALIELAWPELLSLPINRYPGWRHWAGHGIRRVVAWRRSTSKWFARRRKRRAARTV